MVLTYTKMRGHLLLEKCLKGHSHGSAHDRHLSRNLTAAFVFRPIKIVQRVVGENLTARSKNKCFNMNKRVNEAIKSRAEEEIRKNEARLRIWQYQSPVSTTNKISELRPRKLLRLSKIIYRELYIILIRSIRKQRLFLALLNCFKIPILFSR